MLQPCRKQVSSVAELVLAFRGPFAIILAQNYPESGPSFPSHCYIPKHPLPRAVQWLFPGLASPILSAVDLMTYCRFPAQKPRQHLIFAIPASFSRKRAPAAAWVPL